MKHQTWRDDTWNLGLLVSLYVLQGIPLGLAASIPMILSQRKMSYGDQALFSLSFWPFSIKLLWAPLVDSLYFSGFGRRKTWLVPVQYGISLALLWLSGNVDSYLNANSIQTLTAIFFSLNFLAATQDIAVDGWALTILKPVNVGYASTCNTVGQTTGYFLAYVLYFGLEAWGLVTLSGFLFFWAIAFFLATTLVALFKHEKSSEEKDPGPIQTYKSLFKISRLRIMPAMMIALLTAKIGFAASDSITSLKLIEAGIPKDKIVMLGVPIIPLQILLPLFISRYTVGPRPMDLFLKAYPIRLLFSLVLMALVHWTPSFEDNGHFPMHYYAMTLLIYACHQVATNCMFVSSMTFCSQISDPALGGTYMTLLNTLSNLGGNWPSTLALWLVDPLSTKQCNVDGLPPPKFPLNCEGSETECAKYGGKCETVTEGYYIETIACMLIGFAWLWLWGSKTIRRLQSEPISEWRVAPSVKNA